MAFPSLLIPYQKEMCHVKPFLCHFCVTCVFSTRRLQSLLPHQAFPIRKACPEITSRAGRPFNNLPDGWVCYLLLCLTTKGPRSISWNETYETCLIFTIRMIRWITHGRSLRRGTSIRASTNS